MLGTVIPEGATEGPKLVHVCCHCGRVKDADGQWRPPVEPPPEPVSHGICRACFLTFYPTFPLPPEVQ